MPRRCCRRLKALLLLNNEPEFDAADAGGRTSCGLGSRHGRDLSPFKANMTFSDVLLPIAPFTETPGTFVNAEGRVQSFHAVVKPLAETRPAWKVLRVLANLLGLPGFEPGQCRAGARRGAGGGQALTARLDNSAPRHRWHRELCAGTGARGRRADLCRRRAGAPRRIAAVDG